MIERRLTAPAVVFFVLFTVSGFAGLIYQSIWSHYLKLFLGHAAYAQTIVLAMFMGGMAIGAWACARYAGRIRNPLQGYAIAELVIGLMALVFHWVFTRLLDTTYDSIFPALGSSGVEMFKWTLAGALILPQSILLGTTFPLMSAGVLRRFPDTPGAHISLLYFTNSLGAAVGVLASGFYLIGKFGLPGTLMTAGILNIGLALAVWLLAKSHDTPVTMPTEAATGNAVSRPITRVDPRVVRAMLAVALLTGAASFVYEIAWIRMLSLVLGSSTHAFEIMLSALILGIAFGSLWIRGRIDHYNNLLTVLGVVLVAKGLFAIATLPMYGITFDAMQLVVQNLNRSDASYVAFNGFSHLISLAVMFPSAFFAGMSLPLITCYLLKRGVGESAIGGVYAWNTAGAIVGVMFAVHIGLVSLGLKNLIIAAAIVDTGVALLLLWYSRTSQRRWLLPASAVTAVVGIGIAVTVQFDAIAMASGVYRDGKLFDTDSAKVVFSRDGKTATINVITHGDGTASISTNGKTDAALRIDGNGQPEGDEYTMVLAAMLPLAYRPEAKTIANIGFGSGQTAHAVLASPNVTRVDNIEIEPAMIDGARFFEKRVERAFNDKRSHFHIDDAKSFFAAQQSRYDIIISEPSNPWISGVSGLFSSEFYRRVRTHLSDNGLLVQWIQLYEIDTPLVASIMKSLGDHFSDYVAFEISGSDMLIIATPNGRVGEMSGNLFDMPLVAEQLAALNIKRLNDLSMRRIGSKASLDPMLRSYPVPPNSDYFPFVDQNAARSRFLGKKAAELPSLAFGEPPVMDILEKRPFPTLVGEEVEPSGFESPLRQKQAKIAYRVRQYILEGPNSNKRANLLTWQTRTAFFNSRLANCEGVESDQSWSGQMKEIGKLLSSFTAPRDAADVWNRIEASKCHPKFNADDRQWLALFRAVSDRDSARITAIAGDMLDGGKPYAVADKRYLVEVALAAALSDGRRDLAVTVWNKHGREATKDAEVTAAIRLLLAMASR